MASPLWSGKVESWLEGLAGRNEGHLLYSLVALIDLDYDGRRDLLVMEFKQAETETERIEFAPPKMKCEAFLFDAKARRFIAQKSMSPQILYPGQSET